MKRFHVQTILCLFLALVSTQASAWWNDKWSYRVPLTLDASITGANVTATQTDVPVLVRLHAGNFQDFFLLKEDLADLRFVANDDKTPLKHYVELFDPVNQMLFVWVKVPQLTAGIATERVWMYYGNAEAIGAVVSGDAYEINQSLALPFSTADAQITDKTAYANAVETKGVKLNPASIIGSGAQFAGTDHLIVADSASLRLMPDAGATFSAWVKPAATQVDGVIFARHSGSSHVELAMSGNILYAKMNNGGSAFETPRSVQLTPDSWQHVALVLAKDTLRLLVNGQMQASIPVQWNELGGSTFIGANQDGQRGFIGELDEVHVDKIARNDDWIKLAALNQGPQDTLIAVQQAEQLGSGGEGHLDQLFDVILGSLDAAGWAVIFVLAIMAVLCWMVTIGKTLYIRQASKDNDDFLAQYKKLAGQDPAILDMDETSEDAKFANSPIAQAIFGKHDHFQSSQLYHLYHRGIFEVRGRLGNSVGARASGLTPQAIDSIRAALDADMTREVQKLNGKMAMLTISVSGGPFLGLLGTVIGVMITFAAIAATGDVNIAAIAPGVAAALAATVAGLLVAIPALFAYNYLALRIKDVVADMRVFIDEFVTRLAEYYGQ